MNIGIECNGSFGWRGPSRNIRNIIRSLVQTGREHEFYLYSFKPLEEDLYRFPNARNIIVPYRKGISWLNISLPIAALKNKTDVFLFPQANFWIWKPVKTVIIFRSVAISPWYNGFVEKASAYLRKRRVKKIADAIAAVSRYNAMQLYLTCGIIKEDVNIIYNGIDHGFIDTQINVNLKLGKYILFIGGTEREKNFKTLAKVFCGLLGKYSDIKLVIVGETYGKGETMEERLKFVKNLKIEKSVIFYGVVKNIELLAGLYKGAIALIVPSLHETFGMVAVEAMACGCPVVASHAPAIPEICGDAAVYFDPYDPADMAEKIELVLNDEKLKKELINKGYERIKRYTWESSAKKLLEIIEKVHDDK